MADIPDISSVSCIRLVYAENNLIIISYMCLRIN